MPDTHAPSSRRSLASRFAGAGWLEAVRPTHAGAAVLLAVLAIGLVVEPGGPPATSGAIEPAPLPEIPGGRAARVQAAAGADRVPAAAMLPSRASEAATTGGVEPSAAEAAASPPSLRVTPEELVLGTLEVGRAATGVFTITNRGRSTVSILGVRTTCGCTAAEPGRDRLEPGESTTLEVRFEGKNAGDQTQFVRLVTDDPAGPIIAVRVSARVTDAGAARGDG
jgi:hypothetical protein